MAEDPIARVSADLQLIAKKIDTLLMQSAGSHVAWSLQVWPSADPSGTMAYVGNCSREDVQKAMKECVEKWERDSHVPAHLRN